ncbi:MAG TPA: hypothetical protein VKB96_10875 [Gammaproteobacteria bacterium]|nr:hypothetical protein [Gammaproteobacteria bacterium]
MIDHVREYAEALYRSAGPDAQLGADIIDVCDNATLGEEYSYIFGGVTPEQTSEIITQLEGVEVAFTAPFEDDAFWLGHDAPHWISDVQKVTPGEMQRVWQQYAAICDELVMAEYSDEQAALSVQSIVGQLRDVRQALIDGGALDEGDTDGDIAALVRYLLP